MKDNRDYYDEFANWYERERHHGYHVLIDRLQLGVVQPWCAGKDVLEVGCGTGMILKELAPSARWAVGVDISRGMLRLAHARGLSVIEGSATALPFPDASFDVVCSFKVLPHVADIETALAEVARVLRPGGRAALEFYNRASLRYVIKRLKRPHAVSDSTTDDQVYTRYDSLRNVYGYLPPSLHVTGVRGVRVLTPMAQAHRVPVVGRVLAAAERVARDLPVTRRLGGFMVVLLNKR